MKRADELLLALEDHDAPELQARAAVGLLRLLGAEAIAPVVQHLGAVPHAGEVARALADTILSSEDPRAQGALVELVIAGYARARALNPQSLEELLRRAREMPEGRRTRLIRLVVDDGRLNKGQPAAIVLDRLAADFSGTPSWALVWALLMLPKQHVGPGRDAVSRAHHIAMDHSPRFSPPPEDWEPEEKRLVLRFALNRAHLRADVHGFIKRTEGVWVSRALVEHIARPILQHPVDAALLRARPQPEVSEAVANIGPALGDEARFGPHARLLDAFRGVRAKTRQRIKGGMKRGARDA